MIEKKPEIWDVWIANVPFEENTEYVKSVPHWYFIFNKMMVNG